MSSSGTVLGAFKNFGDKATDEFFKGMTRDHSLRGGIANAVRTRWAEGTGGQRLAMGIGGAAAGYLGLKTAQKLAGGAQEHPLSTALVVGGLGAGLSFGASSLVKKAISDDLKKTAKAWGEGQAKNVKAARPAGSKIMPELDRRGAELLRMSTRSSAIEREGMAGTPSAPWMDQASEHAALQASMERHEDAIPRLADMARRKPIAAKARVLSAAQSFKAGQYATGKATIKSYSDQSSKRAGAYAMMFGGSTMAIGLGGNAISGRRGQ